jgi:hypothetical protein
MAALAAILLPSFLHAQITFQRTYGGADSDYGCSVEQTTDGGYIVTGFTYSYGAGRADMWLIKTDANGDTTWTRTFGGAEDDAGRSVQQTRDGGFIVAGTTNSSGAGGDDIWLVRVDAGGNRVWSKTLGGAGQEAGGWVQQTGDGGFIIVGTTRSYGAGSCDVWLIKTDVSGDTVWTRTYGGSAADIGNAVQQTDDAGFIITGFTESRGAGGRDVWLVKTNAGGDTIWTRTFGGPGGDEGSSVRQTQDGGYVIASCTESEGLYDAWLIRTDASGSKIWDMAFGGTGDDWGNSVQPTQDGGCVMAGETDYYEGGFYDAWLIRTDANGDTVWTNTYGGADDDYGNSVQQTTDRGYVVAGYTFSFGATSDNVYLIKTDSLGLVSAVAEPKASPTRAPALSLTCEPNPFRTRTAISLQLAADSPAEVAIFDAGGRRVRTLTVHREPCTVWDGRDDYGQPLASGTYFMRLVAAGQHATTRLVLQR